MSVINKPSKLETGGMMMSTDFPALLKQAVYGICLNIKKHVVATQKDFVVLRRCSELLETNPGYRIHIISSKWSVQTRYITKTLMHLGVSCGQIELSDASDSKGIPNGLWLVVAES